jgi:hypothetical protein
MDLMTKYRTIYSEANGANLQAEIDKIAAATVADIVKLNRWTSSNETIRLEAEADKIQHDVISGRGKLIDFREACERWKKAGTK